MWQAGGERWQQWYPAIREALVATQLPSGEWADPVGPVYATAMATMILQLPHQLLPIFQR